MGETPDQPNRLLHPEVDGKRASWDAALDAVAEGFSRALRAGGQEHVALYVSGQLLTEDYYAANTCDKGLASHAPGERPGSPAGRVTRLRSAPRGPTVPRPGR